MGKYDKWPEEEGINLETPARILKPLPHERMTSDVIKKSFKTFALNLSTAGSENNISSTSDVIKNLSKRLH